VRCPVPSILCFKMSGWAGRATAQFVACLLAAAVAARTDSPGAAHSAGTKIWLQTGAVDTGTAQQRCLPALVLEQPWLHKKGMWLLWRV